MHRLCGFNEDARHHIQAAEDLGDMSHMKLTSETSKLSCELENKQPRRTLSVGSAGKASRSPMEKRIIVCYCFYTCMVLFPNRNSKTRMSLVRLCLSQHAVRKPVVTHSTKAHQTVGYGSSSLIFHIDSPLFSFEQGDPLSLILLVCFERCVFVAHPSQIVMPSWHRLRDRSVLHRLRQRPARDSEQNRCVGSLCRHFHPTPTPATLQTRRTIVPFERCASVSLIHHKFSSPFSSSVLFVGHQSQASALSLILHKFSNLFRAMCIFVARPSQHL